MIPSLHDMNDYKIFLVTKMDDGYDIVVLPQPLSVRYSNTYVFFKKEYIIEWQQDIGKLVYSNLSNFLIICTYNAFNNKINTEVLHVFAFDCLATRYNTDISTPITYKYRCAVQFAPTPNEEEAISIINDHFRDKLNKLRGNNIHTTAMDKLQNESDKMNETEFIRNIASKICDASPVIMPAIADIYYNAPYTTVKWANGSTTTVAATSDEEFNKEVGLAMAMSRKYCECMGLAYPRAGFKRMVNNAHDQTAKTAARKAYKNSKKLLKAADISSEESEDHGLNSNS